MKFAKQIGLFVIRLVVFVCLSSPTLSSPAVPFLLKGTGTGSGTPPIVSAGQDAFGNYYIGRGCTTWAYVDEDCDNYGPGVKSDNSYLLESAALSSDPVDTPGDKPDADDTDPTVNTTASWLAKWGSDNAGMVNFLRQREGLYSPTTDRIFYIAKDGDDTTGVVNDPAHPFLTNTKAIAALQDRMGGMIIYRAGVWSNCLNCGAVTVTGSPSKPVLIKGYPGELVIATPSPGNTSLSFTTSSSSGPASGNVIVEGIAFKATAVNTGDPISTTDTDHLTIRYSELIGGRQDLFSSHTENVLFERNVCHQMWEHCIYFGWTDIRPESIPTDTNGDPDFDAAEVIYLANGGNRGFPPSRGGVVRTNVEYNGGSSGYEPFHLNAYLLNSEVSGNIQSFNAGACIGVQTGNVGTLMENNACFDSNYNSVSMYFYIDCSTDFSQNNVKWRNNSFWSATNSTPIRNLNYRYGGPVFGSASTCANPNQPNYRNFNLSNNIIANDKSANWSFAFGKFSHPESDTLDSNVLFNTASGATLSPGDLLVNVFLNASNGGSIADGKYSFTALSAWPNFTHNKYADPLFTDASRTYTLTPGKFNLMPRAGSPAIGAVAGLAPKGDIRGVLRGTPATAGAYEWRGGSTAPIPVANLMVSSRVIHAGDSATVTWNSIGAASCTGINFSTGGAGAGTATVTPSANTTYEMTCTPAPGYESSVVAPPMGITVRPMTRVPTLTLTGPTSVVAGGTATLSYTITPQGSEYYSCAGGNVNPPGLTTGAFRYNTFKSGTNPHVVTATTTFTLTCFDRLGATVSKSWLVTAI